MPRGRKPKYEAIPPPRPKLDFEEYEAVINGKKVKVKRYSYSAPPEGPTEVVRAGLPTERLRFKLDYER